MHSFCTPFVQSRTAQLLTLSYHFLLFVLDHLMTNKNISCSRSFESSVNMSGSVRTAALAKSDKYTAHHLIGS